MDTSEPVTVKRRRTREDRRRTARACDRCRRLKERCEGGIPCSRCMHLHRTCEFKRLLSVVDHDRAPGPLPTESTAPSSPDANVPELLERVMYMENILKHKFDGIDLDIDSLRRMSRALDEYEQNSTLAPPDEDPIEEEVCTIDPVEDTTTHYSGEFSYWNFSMRVKRHIEDRMQAQDPLQVSNYWRAEQLHSGTNSIAAAISCCPPRHIADFLIKVFFKHAETYYVIDKNWLVEKVDALYNDPGRFGNKGASVVSVILTVFAIATQYAYLDSPGQKSTEFSEDALGTMFYQQAIRLLPEIIEASSLESVQACLLFAIYALPLDASGLGYIYITLTNRLGMQNGMHRKYTGTGLSAAMIETRNRVWWTAYTIERKISIFHGRPLSTHRFDVDAPLPTPREDLHSDGPISTISYMAASIQLTRRLEDLCQEMFLLRTRPKHERSAVLSRLVTGKTDLDAWWNMLPDEMQNVLPSQHTNFRAGIHLRLEYCLVSMFIGRPLLLNRISSRSAPTSPENSNSGGHPEDTGAVKANKQASYRQQLVDSCIESAKEALRLCGVLRNHGPGLARASYIEYSSCRASLLVLIARSIQDQSSEFRRELREGLEMVREMAASGESARSEVALLESLERALGRLNCPNSTENRETSETRPASDYEGFKNWETLWKSGGSSLSESSAGLPAGQWTLSPSGAHWGSSLAQRTQTGPFSSTVDHNENLPDLHSPHSFDTLPFDNGDLHLDPELRFLQEFLAIPGYRFDAGLAIDNELGLGGTETPFPG
ncbi:transcription factor domain-containing protein [Aspergillus mulundensis]|uniref:Putative Zn(II)2Cys6 transcription factor n=1 Tax=Aspergillus mulundensis TaxID=1810919 RepID=A0A3D8T2A8_9EURO|nr:putative Zn(II)2Cys6 transcription factor [Aspergillus mulundensis]RDW92696.1 putative Zn(II)2Cys6 transcription factor [Aspergillus mulundensis]